MNSSAFQIQSSQPMQPLTMLDKSISKEQWEARMSQIQPNRELLNELVMNFLIVEGYKEGALKFQKESGIKAEMDEDLIEHRIEVRRLIERGDIEDAIKKINEINPEILDQNTDLYFELKRQQLVELIKMDKAEEAIAFAQHHLSAQMTGARVVDKAKAEKYQNEVNKTMTLLMYVDLSQAPMQEMIGQAARQRLASAVNQSILRAQGHSSELKLAFYWQLLQFAQNQITGVEFPKMTDPLDEEESKI